MLVQKTAYLRIKSIYKYELLMQGPTLRLIINISALSGPRSPQRTCPGEVFPLPILDWYLPSGELRDVDLNASRFFFSALSYF